MLGTYLTLVALVLQVVRLDVCPKIFDYRMARHLMEKDGCGVS